MPQSPLDTQPAYHMCLFFTITSLDSTTMKDNNMAPGNDGGIVVALFLMTATITGAIIGTVSLYERSTEAAADRHGTSRARLLRLLAGWANLGNSAIHVLLTAYTLSNAANDSAYWTAERALGGVEGPVGLAVLNCAAGLCALRGYGMTFPLGWNAFVACAGTCLPVVWARFLEVGLAAWPYTIVFVWFAIFFFELMALTCSVAHFAIEKSDAKDTGKGAHDNKD